nr:hypothetical protein [uncultured Campylobacter sp.]
MVCALSNLKLKFCEVLLWQSSARSVKFYRTKYRAGFWNFKILRRGGLDFEILRAVNLGLNLEFRSDRILKFYAARLGKAHPPLDKSNSKDF